MSNFNCQTHNHCEHHEHFWTPSRRQLRVETLMMPGRTWGKKKIAGELIAWKFGAKSNREKMLKNFEEPKMKIKALGSEREDR